MSVPQRYGITFPFDGIPLLEQRELVRELVDLGYTDLWSAESGGYDAFIPLAVAAQWAPEVRLGTAIVPAYTRGAHTFASTVASIRHGMLRLAGREGDGAIVNWLSADDVKTVAPHVGPDKEIAARIFVLPSDDAGLVYAVGKRAIASYLTVPVYAAFHEWLGR